jgi:TPR repeat protein
VRGTSVPTNLGYFYETGVGGPANPAEAAKWYLRAAVSGLFEHNSIWGRFIFEEWGSREITKSQCTG